MREIKFRAWFTGSNDEAARMFSWEDVKNDNAEEFRQYADNRMSDVSPLMQYTGLKDKNDREIYESDFIRVRKPAREQQTHEGENIPTPDNRYTEPLEPFIEEKLFEILFEDGIFGVRDEDEHNPTICPLVWLFIDFTDIDILKQYFEGHWNIYLRKGHDGDWDEDLKYILEEYHLKDMDGLIDYLGVEVIGNIYENPELLEANV